MSPFISRSTNDKLRQIAWQHPEHARMARHLCAQLEAHKLDICEFVPIYTDDTRCIISTWRIRAYSHAFPRAVGNAFVDNQITAELPGLASIFDIATFAARADVARENTVMGRRLERAYGEGAWQVWQSWATDCDGRRIEPYTPRIYAAWLWWRGAIHRANTLYIRLWCRWALSTARNGAATR